MGDRFSVSGMVDGKAVTISWLDGVFDDPSGQVDLLIAQGETVGFTPTGPFYTAAAKPVEVALTTAWEALDSDAPYEFDEAAKAVATAMHDDPEIALPDGAVA